MNNKIKCSVGILTFNSEKTLEKALNSVKDFAEIIICDGGSTDNTLEIANRYSCRIIRQDDRYKNKNGSLNDFSGVRNQCIDVAINDWVFMLDSDEIASSVLVEEIRHLVRGSNINIVYGISPQYDFPGGRSVVKSAALPSYQYRIFNKRSGLRYIKKVHERLNVDENIHILKKLSGHKITEWTKDDIKSYKKKQDYYLQIEKERLKKASLFIFLRQILRKLKEIVKRILIIFFYLIKQNKSERMPLYIELLSIRYVLKLLYFQIINYIKYV